MDVTNLSLDDYIRQNDTLGKILKFQKERYSKSSFSDINSSSKFDRPSLQDNADDSDEDMLDLEIKKEDETDIYEADLDVTNNVDSVCSDPVSEVLNKPLREFITMEKMHGIHIESQQWRLEPLNVIFRRKKGMPYLIKKKQSFPCIPKKYLTGSVKDGKIVKMKVMKKGNLFYKYKDNNSGEMIGISTCHPNDEKKDFVVRPKKTADPDLMISKFLGDLAKQIQEPDDGPKIKTDPDADVSDESINSAIPKILQKALNKMQKKVETPEVQEVSEFTEDYSDMPPLIKKHRQIRSFGLNFEITKYNGNL